MPETTRMLVEVRVSQINGCGLCLDMHSAGDPDGTINAWNRQMVTTRQSGGDWFEQIIEEDRAHA